MPGSLLLKALVGLACALTLSGCLSVNPAGLIAASRLDPLNTAPSDIDVAVGVQDNVRLTDGDAEFRIAFRSDGATSAFLVDETVPLQLRPITNGTPEPNADDEIVYSARFADEDAARIAAAQAQIRALRARGIDGKGTLGVSVVGGCLVGATLNSLRVSTWLQTNPQDGYVSLTRGQDMLRAVGESDAAALRAQLVPCGDESPLRPRVGNS
ncbi:MAG: hypothetical protein AAGD34_13775 [Pseudomonadota bacterium]